MSGFLSQKPLPAFTTMSKWHIFNEGNSNDHHHPSWSRQSTPSPMRDELLAVPWQRLQESQANLRPDPCMAWSVGSAKLHLRRHPERLEPCHQRIRNQMWERLVMKSKKYSVVTRNHNETYSWMFSGTRAECRKFILGRWGHWPPFAAITARESHFERCF